MHQGMDRGIALVVVIIYSLIISLIGMSFIYLYSMEEIAARRDINSARTLYLAEAGVERAKAWLLKQRAFPESVNPAYSAPFQPFGGDVLFEPTPASAQGYYRVSITPSPAPYPANNLGVIGTYLIVSTGIVTSGVSGTYDSMKMERTIVRIATGTQSVPPATTATYFTLYSSTPAASGGTTYYYWVMPGETQEMLLEKVLHP